MSTLDEGDDEYGYGRATNVKVEAGFSAAAFSAAQARRSQQSTPAKPTSSWDDSSESEDSEDSELDVVGTIHQDETPWFNVEEHGVVHEAVMNKTMDEFEEEESEWDLDCPLLFRPFMFKLLERLRQRLDDQKTYEFLLEDVPGKSRRPEFSRWGMDVVFPVKRRRLLNLSMVSRESDTPEF
jgi:hypothetical protein